MLKTRILSMACSAGEAPDQKAANLNMVLACLDRAAAYRPDFVCFPEIVLHQRLGFPEAIASAEPVPGPAVRAVSEKARRLNSHVIFPMVETRNGVSFNAAVFVGRKGEIAGVYHKFHATAYEMADGIMPGDEVPVWETDRGRVGAAICFDLKFPEVGLRLSRARAKVAFWPSMFPGGERLRAWAMDYGMYMVKCTAGAGAILDPAGQYVASEGQHEKLGSGATLRITFSEINTDRTTYHIDYNAERLPEIMARYGEGVEVFRMQPEGTFSLASRMEDTSVEDIEREFDLEDLRAYLDRSAEARNRRLAEKV